MDIRTLNAEGLTYDDIINLMQILEEDKKLNDMSTGSVIDKVSKRNSKILGLCGKYLMEVGINPSLKGYHYFREAVVINLNSNVLVKKGTSELYKLVAENFQKKEACIERAMRYAVSKAWNEELWSRALDVRMISSPSNTQMIFLLCEIIRQKCGE